MSKFEWEEADSEEVHIIRVEEDGIYFDRYENVNNDAPWIDGTFLSWKDLWEDYSRTQGFTRKRFGDKP